MKGSEVSVGDAYAFAAPSVRGCPDLWVQVRVLAARQEGRKVTPAGTPTDGTSDRFWLVEFLDAGDEWTVRAGIGFVAGRWIGRLGRSTEGLVRAQELVCRWESRGHAAAQLRAAADDPLRVVRCAEPGCTSTIPAGGGGALRATTGTVAWFREYAGDVMWCPRHVPEWVPAWRERRARTARGKGRRR